MPPTFPLCPTFFGIGLGKLHRPTRMAILQIQFGGLVFPVVRNAAFLDQPLLLAVRIALARSSPKFPLS